MNKWFIALSMIISLNGVAQTKTGVPQTPAMENITGIYTGEVSGTHSLSIHGSTGDYALDINKLSPAQISRIKSAKDEAISFSVPKTAVMGEVDTTYQGLGVRADCSELPIKQSSLDKLVSSSKIKNQQDFLDSIPAGTLQQFTFVYDSESIQRGVKNKNGTGEVSPKSPRIVRSSIDGKLTMTYVCDKDNPMYGTVEVLAFDDATKKFKTTEYDFRKKGPPGDRVHGSPDTCVKCHGSTPSDPNSDLKPIWPEYFSWSDTKHGKKTSVYGSSDDNMGAQADFPGQKFNDFQVKDGLFYRQRDATSSDKYPTGWKGGEPDKEADFNFHKEEVANFVKFKESTKSDPCFSSLPWPKVPPGKENVDPYRMYKYYPYAIESQNKVRGGNDDYSLRTNLRFNDSYGHLNASRISNAVMKSPNYKILKYYLALEATACITDEDKSELHDLMPELDLEKHLSTDDQYKEVGMNPQQAPILYSYAKSIGLKDEDWTLEFRGKDTLYRTGIASGGGGDIGMHKIAQGEMLQSLARENASLGINPEGAMTKGIEKTFGRDFACMDQLGGGVAFDLYKFAPTNACDKLRAENKKNIAELKASGQCNIAPVSAAAKALKKQVAIVSDQMSAESIKRGKDLVNGGARCIECHSPTPENLKSMPKEFLFIENPAVSADQNQSAKNMLQTRMKEGYAEELKSVLKSGEMPMDSKIKLGDQDQADIVNYLKSLNP